jgi:multidrug efflux system outer membrane protein
VTLTREHTAVAFGLAAATLAACTVGPNYRPPVIASPPAYAEAASTARTAISGADADLSAWWTQFDDPLLTSLIGRALAGSPTLASAQSKVREARLQEIVAGAAEYPKVSAAANAVRLAAPGDVPLPIPSPLNLYSVGFDATWEVDLFGGTRRSVEAAKADTQGSLWTLRDGEVQLAAEVANAYLTLREAQARIVIGEAELARQRGLFTIIQQRRQTGFVTSLDVNQQSTAVETAAAQLPQLEAQASAQIHALGVLIGQPPEALARELSAGPATIPPPPPNLPVGLPSQLLLRRPDIRAAERRLAAANAQIGVHTADLYPKVDLIGLASLASTSVGNLFSTNNFSSALLALGSETLFDAGRTRAQIGEAREERTQALLAWRNTVLGALRDVEDALARYRSEEERRGHLVQSVIAARSTLAIAEDQYRTGFITFINVLGAQDALLNAQDQLAQSDASVASDIVAVYKALGGGWSTAPPPARRDDDQ